MAQEIKASQLIGKRTFIGEETVRAAMNENTGKEFIKLKNPDWNPRRELDGNCAELECAFQYHGQQHYEWRKFFHKRESDYLAQRYRDKETEKACIINGTTLITVPYYVGDIRGYVRDCLIEMDIPVIPEVDLMDDDAFKLTIKGDEEERRRLMAEIHDIAELHEGRCIDRVYIDADHQMRFECKEKHRFTRSSKRVKDAERFGQGFCVECQDYLEKGTRGMIANIERFGWTFISWTFPKGDKRRHRNVDVMCPLGHDPFNTAANKFSGIDLEKPRVLCPICKDIEGPKPRDNTRWTEETARVAVESCGYILHSRYPKKVLQEKGKNAGKMISKQHLNITCPNGHVKEILQNNFLPLKPDGSPRQGGCTTCQGLGIGKMKRKKDDQIADTLAKWELVLIDEYLAGEARKKVSIEYQCLKCETCFKDTWNNILKRFDNTGLAHRCGA